MKVPISWLKDYVEIDVSLEEVAKKLTMAGLEVEDILLVGLPMPPGNAEGLSHEFSYSGLTWEPEKIVVAQIDEVLPHPNADRLVLCRLNDGHEELIVLTGAPNLYEYKGQGPLAKPLKVAYAKEGAKIYDGHQPGQVLTTLKRAKIRGVESFSMVCSEKELGISEEHEGIIILDDDAPTGMPLVDYMGDAVLNISILPNMIRDAGVIGVARELAALTNKPLQMPQLKEPTTGPSVVGQVAIEIREPEYNSRFATGLIRGVKPQPSPYWVQRRLRMAGMRPINSLVDATNYVMLETSQPLHAFDYRVLVKRANGHTPTIITRRAQPGEKLTTLDDVDRTLNDFTVLVCDTAGPLSIAGVMGGLESEVTEETSEVLLEGASWNFINIRQTVAAQKLNSEAGYRFSRGVHPALAPWAVQLCLERMAQWAGGEIAAGMVDEYPAPVNDPEVSLDEADIRRALGIELDLNEISQLLTRLDFTCRIEHETLYAQTPPHRLDIGTGLVGKADLIEEVARLYGYDNLPYTRLADSLPPTEEDSTLWQEDHIRDLLVSLGLDEAITYRMTSPDREKRLWLPGSPEDDARYIKLANPISPERSVMRRSVLASVLEVMEHNSRLRDRLAFFELGPAFWPSTLEGELPEEHPFLAIALSGQQALPAWDRPTPATMDFYDLKGVIEGLLEALHVAGVRYEPAESFIFHPGKCARIWASDGADGEVELGAFGELDPRVRARYEFTSAPMLAAELDLPALLSVSPVSFAARPVSPYPPVLEDLAVVVDEDVPAEQVATAIRQGGGKLLAGLRLFDIYRGGQIGPGKKSLAYSLTYQASDRTLSDKDAAQIRQRIIRRLEHEVGATLRK